MSSLVRGAADVGRALSFVRHHRRTWSLLVAPALVTVVLLVAIVAGVVWLSHPLVEWLGAHLPSWLERVGMDVLSVIEVAGLVVAAGLAYVSVVGAVAGPFNELLSERVEELVTGAPTPRFSLGAFVRGLAVGIAHGLRRLAIALAGIAVVFAIGFVPAIGPLPAALLAFWIAARAAAYDSYDAVMSRRELRYRDKAAYLASHRGRTFGLGATVAGMLLVPGLNLVALGLGAVGATLADLDHQLPAWRRSLRPEEGLRT
jgi:CysZ protein